PCISHKRRIAETWRNAFQVPIYRPWFSSTHLANAPLSVRFQRSTRQVLCPMSNNRRDALLITQVMKALDVKYRLAEKMAQEPGLKDIIQQFIGRIEHAFGSLAHVKGRRILDIACGSNTSKAPESFFVNTPFGERTI